MTTTQANELKKLREKLNSGGNLTPRQTEQLRKLEDVERSYKATIEEAARRAKQNAAMQEERRLDKARKNSELIRSMEKRAKASGSEFDSVRAGVCSLWNAAHEKILRFHESNDLLAYPYHAIAWMGDVVEAAATRSLLDTLFTDDVSDEGLETAVVRLVDDARVSLINNRWGGSSSGYTQRMMDAATREAASMIIRELEWRLKLASDKKGATSGDASTE